MQHPSSHVANSKPVLLACAISFALAACGGSGNDNHAAPEQPQTPAAPQGTPTPPPATDKTPAPKAPQQTPDKPSKPDNKNSNTPAPEKPASPQNPKQGPALPMPPQGKTVPDAQKYSGPAFFNIGQKAVIYNIFSDKVQHSYTVGKETLGIHAAKLSLLALEDNKLKGYQAQNNLELSKGTHEATIEMSKGGQDKIQVKLNYTGEAFGYEKAQAFHFYGKMTHPLDPAGKPFDAAYTVGTLAPTKVIDAMQGEIQYQGGASFRAYENPADKLATGTAAFTLDMTKKAITNATIDLQTSIGKTYTFASADKPISILVKGKTNNSFMTDKFKNAEAPQALRGYFYGDQAQHIGGVYYTKDGGGAFMTEKQ